MNEAVLSERLRALREPAPRNGFDERLQQALWREAAELRAERTLGVEPAQGARSLRRVRRFGGRVGLGMIIVCGATAAAAAGGIWAAVAYSQRSAPEPAVPPPATEAAGAEMKRVAAPNVPSEAPPAERASAELPSGAEPAVLAAPTPEPAVAPARPADPARAVSAREKPRSANPESAVPERSPPSAPALVPFELPTRAGAERAEAAGAAKAQPSRLDRLQLPEPRGAAEGADPRALPGLPARADRRSRRDNSASERGAAPPGLEIARERASEKAERGQERAREARERK